MFSWGSAARFRRSCSVFFFTCGSKPSKPNFFFSCPLFRLAYSSLHEASTALLPYGCPICRCHQRQQGEKGPALVDGEAEPGAEAEAEAEAAPQCDICELSASVVMRGIGLMEREKDYDNAFHYLHILVRVRLDSRVSGFSQSRYSLASLAEWFKWCP